MIKVTERAREELKKILSDNTDNPEESLRLAATAQGQLGLAIDVELPGDQVVEHEGSKVLLVQEELAVMLLGITLDVEDAPEGPRLIIISEP
ncbi:MAG TPA: hypothetical protein EYP71_01030 [Dehalococcoidia bacterium]|nr:hypothetical protein [Dehalococcoidia bacterium]